MFTLKGYRGEIVHCFIFLFFPPNPEWRSFMIHSLAKWATSSHHSNALVILIIMDEKDGRIGGINSLTGQLTQNQTSCACTVITLPSAVLFSCFIHLQQGNPDFFILVIVIYAWIPRAAREGGREGELDRWGIGSGGGGGGEKTRRCPCWQRCIKAGMSHPICCAHLTASKGGSSVPLFSP